MTEGDGGPRRERVLVDGLGPGEAVVVHREALHVLRPDIESAHLDVYTDTGWPPAVLHSFERALALARAEVADGSRSRRADPGMGIGIDVRDDTQFGVLVDLVPHTINAEGWRGDRMVFSAADSGTGLWMAVTENQEAALLSRLGALGIPPTVLAGAGGARPRTTRSARWLRTARRSSCAVPEPVTAAGARRWSRI
ncbi:hypothetical protein I3F58_06975 [Streptomyces sp. MUM 203J]|uniref:hypothetical protein n=1 Tax=Streptomyces sp. MUM 203J TaxID=2791990 RepID=UPI001F043B56|nr:hypothetical protein [Streptomyces sp. MUM 203J]MCH0539306.1 hypothetical protein [Streptomyces sp. MUM 203J]